MKEEALLRWKRTEAVFAGLPLLERAPVRVATLRVLCVLEVGTAQLAFALAGVFIRDVVTLKT